MSKKLYYGFLLNLLVLSSFAATAKKPIMLSNNVNDTPAITIIKDAGSSVNTLRGFYISSISSAVSNCGGATAIDPFDVNFAVPAIAIGPAGSAVAIGQGALYNTLVLAYFKAYGSTAIFPNPVNQNSMSAYINVTSVLDYSENPKVNTNHILKTNVGMQICFTFNCSATTQTCTVESNYSTAYYF